MTPNKPRRKVPPGPTMEELDRLIAEQSRPENLPRWWPTAEKKSQTAAGGKSHAEQRRRGKLWRRGKK